MMDSLYVAWRYLSFNLGRSLTLVACVTHRALSDTRTHTRSHTHTLSLSLSLSLSRFVLP